MNFSPELVVLTDRRFLSRDPASPEMLQMIGVDPKWVDYIRVLDRQGTLVLLHYLSTVVPGTDRLNEDLLKEIGGVRGVILDLDTGKVVCRSFEYTPEVLSSDAERVARLIPDPKQVRFFNACEGTVIRLYHYAGEWRIATHRKINAERSYWASVAHPFGVLFNNLRKFDYNTLNADYCYIFLMSDNNNRLVYKVPDAGQLLLLSVYDRGSDRLLDLDAVDSIALDGVSHPELISNVNDYKELQDVVNQYAGAYRFDRAGVMAFDPTAVARPVKVMHGGYAAVRDARGSEPNLRARYFHVRGTLSQDLLCNWFSDPEYQAVWDAAEAEVNDLVKVLHQMYIHRYIKKNFGDLPKEEFVVLKRCHTWHSEDRQTNIVTREKMREFVNTTPGHYLLTILNRRRRAEKAKQRLAAATFTDAASSPSPTKTPTPTPAPAAL